MPITQPSSLRLGVCSFIGGATAIAVVGGLLMGMDAIKRMNPMIAVTAIVIGGSVTATATTFCYQTQISLGETPKTASPPPPPSPESVIFTPPPPPSVEHPTPPPPLDVSSQQVEPEAELPQAVSDRIDPHYNEVLSSFMGGRNDFGTG